MTSLDIPNTKRAVVEESRPPESAKKKPAEFRADQVLPQVNSRRHLDFFHRIQNLDLNLVRYL
jgi:hypothetical protein